ncbi:LAMI_0F04654g1_1 [Lachancea mirantina]|uniref:LAMI_0F04654g1_1 n=1 Tax=Lachancea mirantina TaxID=1230905 RepID=A0A1G4JXY5_9SACH|nr:LAMI_0F04654g1_1 [Lachancea mirantina]
MLRNGPSFFKPSETIDRPLHFRLLKSDSIATAFPVYSAQDIPEGLVHHLHDQFNAEIEAGNTYPLLEKLSLDEFVNYWFHSFCVVVIKTDADQINASWTNWNELFLGTFYIKPNYVGRCSHNCNGGFLVSSHHRGQKIGYRLGQVYLKWAPLLGYQYSVFNLVFATNVASWKLWDAFKFNRIGCIPKAAVLKGHDDRVDAIMYGKDLTSVEPELLHDLTI